MKHPCRWLLIGSITTATVGVIVLVLTTPLVSNALLLLMERSNFIPAESSILTFEPYAINDGSSNYWLYGKDRTYYYHFTYEMTFPTSTSRRTTAAPVSTGRMPGPGAAPCPARHAGAVVVQPV